MKKLCELGIWFWITIIIGALLIIAICQGLICFSYPVGWVELGVIATSFMAIFTYITLRNSQKQLLELKRAYSANIRISIIISNDDFYLEIKNIGIYIARNISLKFNSEFVNSLPNEPNVRSPFEKMSNNPIHINGGDRKTFYLMPIFGKKQLKLSNGTTQSLEDKDAMISNFLVTPIHITGSYWDSYTNHKVNIVESFQPNGFITEAVEIK